MTKFIYNVYAGDLILAGLEDEQEAMAIAREEAKKHAVRVEKAEVQDDYDFGNPTQNAEVIWQSEATGEGTDARKDEECNPFDTDFPRSDIEDATLSDDADYYAMAKQYEDEAYADTTPAD